MGLGPVVGLGGARGTRSLVLELGGGFTLAMRSAAKMKEKLVGQGLHAAWPVSSW